MPTILVVEDHPDLGRAMTRLLQASGYDAVWADDIHHSAFVALTGRGGAYMSDYSGRPQELLSAFRRGYLFQGQGYSWHDTGRGTPGLKRFAFNLTHSRRLGSSSRTLWA